MPSPIVRYPLDLTGVNPDNFVSGEIKTLAVRPVRAVVPSYGPFFNDDTLVVFDNTTGVQLIKNTDYKVTGLLQEATFKTGKEICEVILILNTNVSSQVRINYQSLGGLYQSNSTNLRNLWDTILQDTRPVDWESIFDKPFEFPPSLHSHLLSDLYGFEPLVAAIERLRTALILGDVPAFELVLDQVRQLREDFLAINAENLQALLVSGQNIKTINGQSLLGSGNLQVTSDISGKQDKLISGFNIKTINGVNILGSGNITVEGAGSGSVVYGTDTRSFIQRKISYLSSSGELGVDATPNNYVWTKPAGCIAVDIIAVGPHLPAVQTTLNTGDNSFTYDFAGVYSAIGVSKLNTVPDTITVNIGYRSADGTISPLSVQYDSVNATLAATASGFTDINQNGGSFNFGSFPTDKAVLFEPGRDVPIGYVLPKADMQQRPFGWQNNSAIATNGEVYIIEWYSNSMPSLKTINGESLVGSGNIEIETSQVISPLADVDNDIYPIGCLLWCSRVPVSIESIRLGSIVNVFKNSNVITGIFDIDFEPLVITSHGSYTLLSGTWRVLSLAHITVNEAEYINGVVQRIA